MACGSANHGERSAEFVRNVGEERCAIIFFAAQYFVALTAHFVEANEHGNGTRGKQKNYHGANDYSAVLALFILQRALKCLLLLVQFLVFIFRSIFACGLLNLAAIQRILEHTSSFKLG